MSEERSNAATDEVELERLDDEALARLVKERANQPTIQDSVEDLSGLDDGSDAGGLQAEERKGEYRVVPDPVRWVRPEAVTRHDKGAATWKMLPLKKLGSWSGGGTPSKAMPAYWESGSIPWVSPKDMKTERIQNSEDHITLRAVSESTAKLIPAGSVLLVTRSGNLRHTLPVAVTTVPVTVNQDLKALTPKDEILPEYVAWTLRAFSQEILNTCSKQGTTVNSLETPRLLRFEIPVAPLDQQERIVAEIEKQFSRLDEAVANLKRVKANLKRYKAAVLKAAVEGHLVETEAELARREGRSYETGEQLLQRILNTRRSQWQGKGKYKEPAAPDTTDLPELPEGWVWATPDQLAMSDDNAICAGPFGTIFKAKDFRDAGVPIIFLRHVSPGQYLTHKPGFMGEQKWQELFQPYSVYGGELLITKLGEPPGACAIYPVGIGPAMVTPDVIKMSVNAKIILSSFLMFYFNSEIARKFSSGVAFGTTRTRLTIPIFREMPVAVPPLTEQHRIVAEVDRRLSLLHETEAQVDANLQRAQRLRQSILSRAFSGDLLAASGLENPIDVGDVPLPAVEPAHCAVAS
jgi:type I restriction enzyme S subunit